MLRNGQHDTVTDVSREEASLARAGFHQSVNRGGGVEEAEAHSVRLHAAEARQANELLEPLTDAARQGHLDESLDVKVVHNLLKHSMAYSSRWI